MGLISAASTMFDAGSMSAGFGGSMTFIKKLTASSSGTLSFVDGASGVVLDDTYKEYVFTFNNIHPATDATTFGFNMSIDTGSNYNVTKTTAFFAAYHNENGSGGGMGYEGSFDHAQATGDQILMRPIGSDNDQASSGYLHLFNPSSTTFVKHFMSITSNAENTDYASQRFASGYGNTTSAVDAVIFRMASGNIDAGDICLYGIL